MVVVLLLLLPLHFSGAAIISAAVIIDITEGEEIVGLSICATGVAAVAVIDVVVVVAADFEVG